jgi:TfoX/Sxy family transcriptional regulator of competence genes
MDEAKAGRIRDMEMALRVALANIRPEAHLSWKSMFGGAGFFVEGRIFAAWFGAELALKLPKDAADELLAQGGASPTESASYTEVPEAFLDNPHLLEPWVARSVDYVMNQSVKKKR